MCFIIYINDLEENIDSTVSKFADDTKLYNDVSTPMGILQIQTIISIKNVFWWPFWIFGFLEKCSRFHSWHSPDSESAEKTDIDTIKKHYICRKTRLGQFSAISSSDYIWW